jgi:hypothetical protein
MIKNLLQLVCRYKVKKGSLVQATPTCTGPGEGSDHLDLLYSLSLHFLQEAVSVFLGLELINQKNT